ncbi:leucine-rich repeat-containing protein 15-like [Drosophila sulfurigaster albostrigata]|uniref:leucine-rich repeat-containing protein 15-like n=1 Tax=Drosophila sulfurigaster albostrigata TaxID=89887 RepID=UPI002D218432|nr:leucine-rich repeat-containing protein 15-like [Drosophila sulfurigaster albostrigata]
MHRLLLSLLLLGVEYVLGLPVYDDSNNLNVSASCPDSTCSLSQLSSTFVQPLRYTDNKALQLEELLLSDCQLRALPVELLRQTPNLRVLMMLNSSVYHVNKDDFQPVKQLKQLQLQRNHISQLKSQQFVLLEQLEVLQLGHNIILVVRGQAFTGLTQLRLLGLQSNGITELADDAFDPLPQLLHLDLSDNEITYIHPRIFEHNTKLQTLLFNGNQFVQFESSTLLPLKNLRLLDLSNCHVEELQLESVHRVRIESSRLQRLIINGGVINLQAGHNELTKLYIGDKSAVIELDLQHNLLDGNATATLLDGMWNLQRLDLSKNNIDSLSPANNSLRLLLPSLTQLNLAYNQLEELSPMLPYRLTKLDISYNHLISVTAANFATLPNLQQLNVQDVRLTDFDYKLFHQQHPKFQEIGVCDSDYRFMHILATFFTDRGIHLPVKCNQHKPSSEQITREPQLQPATEPQCGPIAGVSGIHPYWTTRDVLAFVTLVVVFVILLIQLYHILEEEGCVRRMRQRLRGRPQIVNGTHSNRRLNEEDSETSSA